LEKSDISETEIRSFQDDLHDFMALVPTNKVFDIVLDYLSNDKEVQEIVFELQSEEFPMIHTTVEYLKEYKEVSAFMCMFLKPQSDSENICLVSKCG
jgi:hypothetical protein